MMKRTQWNRVLGCLAISSCLWALCHGAPKWQKLIPSKRVEADPNASYTLSENSGPWMIFAASFAGDGALRDARQLVLELRSRYRLPAYTYKQHYDLSQPVRGNGLNEYCEPKRMRHARNYEYDEVAVLVGDFVGVNEPKLQDVLDLLKHARPRCLDLSEGEDTTLRYAGLRELQKRLTGDKAKQRKGPMGRAFVTRNPLLPNEFFGAQGLDQFVINMNRGVKHSLLDCPGKYSVRVATFRGNVIIDQKEIEMIENGAGMRSHLHVAADKAHRLTEALRAQKIEAYEFHDRHESIVTVGSFDSVGTPRTDGRQEINPAIRRIMDAYGPQQRKLPGRAGQTLAGLQPRSLGGITFDVQPMPVHVPQRSFGADYARVRNRIR